MSKFISFYDIDGEPIMINTDSILYIKNALNGENIAIWHVTENGSGFHELSTKMRNFRDQMKSKAGSFIVDIDTGDHTFRKPKPNARGATIL